MKLLIIIESSTLIQIQKLNALKKRTIPKILQQILNSGMEKEWITCIDMVLFSVKPAVSNFAILV
jgi:hypothetical protein